nr:uncharacterized protein LOC120976827 [Aegilops tauschii subsp. strangulata]
MSWLPDEGREGRGKREDNQPSSGASESRSPPRPIHFYRTREQAAVLAAPPTEAIAGRRPCRCSSASPCRSLILFPRTRARADAPAGPFLTNLRAGRYLRRFSSNGCESRPPPRCSSSATPVSTE